MKRSEAAELVLMLLAAFPNARTTEGTAEIYEVMLSDLDAVLARRAVTQLIASSKFLPTVAEVRSAYSELVRSKRAALAREHAARIPSLPRAQLVQRDERLRLARNNRADEALVVSKGAAASEAVVGESRGRPKAAAHAAAAPAVPAFALRRAPGAPARPPRTWTAAELDAALNDQRQGGA